MVIQIMIPTPNFRSLAQRLRNRKKLSKKARFFRFVVVLVLIGGGGWYVYQKTLTGPAVGTVMASATATDPKPQVELEQFDGTYFSFVHPMNFIEQVAKPQPNLNDIEHHTFLSTAMTSQYLTTIVEKFTSTNLSDDSSYNMRFQNPKKYQRKILVVKNEQVTVFTTDDGTQFEQSAFWLHGGKLLIMTLTGLSGDNQVTINEFTAMVQSLVWR